MPDVVRAAACQLPEVREDIGRALQLIEADSRKAQSLGARLVCLPECCLQGYVVRAAAARRLAMDVASEAFKKICATLEAIEPVLVIGMIEVDGGKLFNTAVVLERGCLLGRYRKHSLLPGESIFEAGTSAPIFEVDGLRFGINICSDTRVAANAAVVAAQGADLIVCPANNMMRRDAAEVWKHRHNETRAQRARETGLWLVSADVTGEDDERISYGPTAVIDPHGSVVAQVPLLRPGLLIYDIPVISRSHAGSESARRPIDWRAP